MKASPFLSTAKAIVLACFTLFVVLPLLVGLFWSAQNWSYTRFCWRSQTYYAQVAAACEQLRVAPEPLPRKLKRGELRSLPPVLHDLDITYMIVDTNMVMMLIGGGLTSGQIIWKLSDDSSCWNLIRGTPETRKSRVIYTKATPLSANPASAVDAPIAALCAFERHGRRATDQRRSVTGSTTQLVPGPADS